MTFRYASLCTGYDGIGQGLALAGLGLAPVFHAEIEPSVADVLKHEQPDVPNIGNIRTAPWHLAPHVDLLSSGDPCQSISIAGRQLGRVDPRFLWPDVRTAYRAMRPRAIFLENVQNMVAHDGGRTMAERFAHLREDGYAVRWTVMGACAVGAPHHRHRWFALAVRVEGPAPKAERIGVKAWCGAPRSGGRVLLPTPTTADGSGGPGESDKRTGGLNLRTAVALLPTPRATDIGTPGRRSSEGWRPQLGQAVQLLPTPRATDGTNGGPAQRGSSGDLAMGSACQPEHWGKYADAVALWEKVTGNPVPAPTTPGPNGGVRLNQRLSEWMMGLRPGLLTDRMSRNDALRAAGNGVVPLQVAAAWKMLTQ